MRTRSLLIPTLALLAGSGVAHAADDMGFQIHGFASQGYVMTHGAAYERGWYGRDTNESGTFEFNEFGVNVVATPIERLRIGAQFIAYDLGQYGNDELQIDWAFGEYQIPVTEGIDVSVVAGRFKTGHAFYNDYRDLDMTRASVFLPRSVYSAAFRDFFLATNGAQVNSNLDAGGFGSFTVSGFVGTQNIDEDEGPLRDVFATGASQTFSGGSTELKGFDYIRIENFNGAHLEWVTPIDGLRLKVSGLYADNFEASGTLTGTIPGLGEADTDLVISVDHWFDLTTGAEYIWGDLTIASELSSQYYTAESVTGNLVFPTGGPPVVIPGRTTPLGQRTLGVYGSASYQLSMLPGPWNKVSVYGAFNWTRSTDTFSDASRYIRTGAVALRYDIVDHFLVKAEFERIQDTSPGAGHLYGNIFSLKTTFDF